MLEFKMYNRGWIGNQHGGGGGRGGTIVVNGKRFRYWDQPGGTVLGGNKLINPCFILLFSMREEAILQSVIEGGACSMDYGATSRDLVRAAVALAIHRGAKTLTLTDNSTKYLSASRKFRLADMYMLATGKTWYEAVLPGLEPHEQEDVAGVRYRVLTNKWADIRDCLRDVEIDLGGSFDADAPGSAMVVFKALKGTRGDFFAEFGVKARRCSGVDSLYGSSWALDLVANAPAYADVQILPAS
jgi:hypothetical protein